jgi:hypothetical protein
MNLAAVAIAPVSAIRTEEACRSFACNSGC